MKANNSETINALAICRDEVALQSLLSFVTRDLRGFIVVSDDLSVHDTVRQYEGLKAVHFSAMEALFDVAPHVLAILNSVNNWLRDQSDRHTLPAEFLYWVQHVEGGDTTQRIQDAILETRSCFTLFDHFKPLKVYIGAGSRSYWEDDILVAAAKERGIPVERLSHFSLARAAFDLWRNLRPLAKEIYRSLRVIDSLIRRKKSRLDSKDSKEYVAIQLCSSMAKHLHHTLSLLRELENGGKRAVAVTWEVGRAVKSLRNQGYRVVELEAWVPLRDLGRSWWTACIGFCRARENLHNLLISQGDDEYAPLIRKVLLAPMLDFFISTVPHRLRLNAACQTFFAKNPPTAARLWTRILEQGVIAYRAMTKVGVRPLLFWQPGWPYQFEWPYLRYDVPADLIFCLSDAHKERLKMDVQQAQSRIVVSGIQWRQAVMEFSSQNSRSHSRYVLGVPANVKLVVFCDAQVVFGGYFTAAEQVLLVRAVVEFAESRKDVCVLIKPHAGQKAGQLEALFAERGKGRVIWIPGKDLPYHALNAADVLLTKVSTMVAEAMILGRPSICVLLDHDMRWAIYKDSVDYAFTIEELNQKLGAMTNARYYSVWVSALRKRQEAYMKAHLPRPQIECNKFVVQELVATLNTERA